MRFDCVIINMNQWKDGLGIDMLKYCCHQAIKCEKPFSKR